MDAVAPGEFGALRLGVRAWKDRRESPSSDVAGVRSELTQRAQAMPAQMTAHMLPADCGITQASSTPRRSDFGPGAEGDAAWRAAFRQMTVAHKSIASPKYLSACVAEVSRFNCFYHAEFGVTLGREELDSRGNKIWVPALDAQQKARSRARLTDARVLIVGDA